MAQKVGDILSRSGPEVVCLVGDLKGEAELIVIFHRFHEDCRLTEGELDYKTQRRRTSGGESLRLFRSGPRVIS